MSVDRPPQVVARATLRLRFQYDDRGVRLVERQRVEKLALPSDPISGHEGQCGFWVELRGPEQRLLHRRVMHDPFSEHVEVFLPAAGQSITRVLRKHRRGTFIIEVPELREAEQLVLFSSAAPPVRGSACAGAPRPAVEVARVPLHEVHPAVDGAEAVNPGGEATDQA